MCIFWAAVYATSHPSTPKMAVSIEPPMKITQSRVTSKENSHHMGVSFRDPQSEWFSGTTHTRSFLAKTDLSRSSFRVGSGIGRHGHVRPRQTSRGRNGRQGTSADGRPRYTHAATETIFPKMFKNSGGEAGNTCGFKGKAKKQGMALVADFVSVLLNLPSCQQPAVFPRLFFSAFREKDP